MPTDDHNPAKIYSFSVTVRSVADGHKVCCSTGGLDGLEHRAFGPFVDRAAADELAEDFRSTCLALGAVEVVADRPN